MKMMKPSLVMLFSICVIKCLGMTQSDLEDFSNFLEITSRLDINLKSKGPEDDYDEDEPVSDHAWEESGKFEGDLILNERQRRLLVADIAEGLSRNGLQDSTKRWPNNEVIYYIQREHFSSGQVQAIQGGIDDLAQVSCVKFTPYKRGDRDAVVIQGSRRGCFSQVGYQGGYQVLNLSGRHPVGRGCFRHGTVVHELLHTLGFYHMQSSPDRDDYINVLWQNIIKPARHNFRKYNSFAVSDFGVGYDYESVLHYSRKAFSSNGQDTLVPKQLGAQIGQRVGLSQKDVQKLNRMYCDADLIDSNNADEDITPKKPVLIKKKSKNKPFDGHGIGYHQGKTVVIKLEPTTVELYRLPTVQNFQTFDYFSKQPQVLSPTLTDTNRRGKEMIYISSTIQSANIDEYYKPTTSKSLIHNAANDEEGYINNRNGISLATPLEHDRTVFESGDHDKRENEPSTTIQRELNDVSEEIKSDIGVTYKKTSNLAKPQPYPAYTDFIRNLPDLQIKDQNSREHSHIETVPLEYQQYFQKQYEHTDKDKNINLASFSPHRHASFVENNSRKTYPSSYNYYDPYQVSNVTEVKSSLKHYLPIESKSPESHRDKDYAKISKNIPSYGSGHTRYFYPDTNYYDKASYTFPAQYN